MKTQFISLLLVASIALARPVPSSSPSPSPDPLNMAAALDRRTLIGNDYAISNQVDNSHGKKVFRVDHNGDSSVHKGLLYDLADPSSSSNEDDSEFQFRRRSLLSDLFGGDSMSISNENDNSKHTQTKNEHDNHYTTITKVHKEQVSNNDDDEDGDEDEMSLDSFFDKRNAENETPSASALNRRGLLFGGDSTTISNVNDNSKHTQTMNIHNNRDTTITKVHKHQQPSSSRPRPRRGDATIPKGFFDRRDVDLNRRSLLGDLFGEKSMSINNVNDNSQTKKTFNSHGNRNTRINKSTRINRGASGSDSDSGFFDKRGLLFGGDSMVITNQNDNSQTKKTLNSHGNRNTRINKSTRINRGGSGSGSSFFDKRGLLFGGDSMVITNQNDNSQTKKTLNSHGNRNTRINKSTRHTNRTHRDRGDSNSGFFDKRGLLFGGDSTTITNQNDNSQNKKTFNSHHNTLNDVDDDDTTVEKNMRLVEDGF
ncbi:hypothetical protein BGZ95_001002 [Linnemannia exigua]|uniref:Uncharacterized protein n=1 Tax=Linnemannia exigua TaxID=604196 RepID=A0AAD4DM62_9FUNG|nr:hypothetical protein BGZ95_001002 [Linnemannia exigua]